MNKKRRKKVVRNEWKKNEKSVKKLPIPTSQYQIEKSTKNSNKKNAGAVTLT